MKIDSNTIVYLNGQFLPLEQAQVSVLDRGFLFGDGVYEVIPVYNGRLFLAEEHLERLEHSLGAIRLKIDVNWPVVLQELVERNGGGNKQIYLQVTRGVSGDRRHAMPEATQATVFASCMSTQMPTLSELAKGYSVITLEDTRWKHCSIKAITLLPNILLYQQALDAGHDEAILVNDGYAIEGTSSNLFIVYDGTLITSPTNGQILGGITRDLILQLALDMNMPVAEQMIPEAQLNEADEIWLSGSTKEIYPVVKLNEQPVNDGKAGIHWQRMIERFQAYKQRFANELHS